jgi:hypothetical protein
MEFVCKYHSPSIPATEISVAKCIHPDHLAANLLLHSPCHVDHEGFDLNEIEQAYYDVNGITYTKDSTWYKDGGKDYGTNAILQTWIEQINVNSNLILDHSHFVFKYPITGAAAEQIKQLATKRPELLRLVSINFKCGLDLCIDYINQELNIVEPVVHIEWDFTNVDQMILTAKDIESCIDSGHIQKTLPAILEFNKLARSKKIDAFAQADVRSLLMFGEKSYKLIPTI